MSRKNILGALDKMITSVGTKTAAAKTAAPGGDLNSDNGTSAPQTGAQMASNKAEAAKGTKAKVDGGAVVNPQGKSVEMSTDGAAAVATSGQEGAKGAVLEVKGEAPNGPEGGLKTASLAEQLRKAASEIEAPAKVVKTAEEIVKGIVKKAAPAPELSALEKWVVASVRAGTIKTAGDMAGAPDAQVADQGGSDLVSQLASGQIPEEKAEQMLVEALKSGAITEEDLMKAMAELHQGGGAGADPAAGGAPADAGAPPAADPAAGAPPAAPADAGAPVDDAALGQKLAALAIDEDHPLYLAKLAQFHADPFARGYNAAIKVGETLLGKSVDDGTKKTEEAPNTAKPAVADGGTKAQVENDVAKKLPAEKAKTAADLPPSPADAGAPAAPADAGAPPAADPMAAHGIAPQGADQQAALDQILQQMGMTPEDLKALLDHQTAPQGDPAQQKVAAYRSKVLGAVLTKHAEIQLATAPAAK